MVEDSEDKLARTIKRDPFNPKDYEKIIQQVRRTLGTDIKGKWNEAHDRLFEDIVLTEHGWTQDEIKNHVDNLPLPLDPHDILTKLRLRDLFRTKK